jgi:hypothetical protein
LSSIKLIYIYIILTLTPSLVPCYKKRKWIFIMFVSFSFLFRYYLQTRTLDLGLTWTLDFRTLHATNNNKLILTRLWFFLSLVRSCSMSHVNFKFFSLFFIFGKDKKNSVPCYQIWSATNKIHPKIDFCHLVFLGYSMSGLTF